MKYAIMVLALVGVLARPTVAIAATGNQMLEWCKQTPGICAFYAAGWRNGHNQAVDAAGRSPGGVAVKGFEDYKFSHVEEANKAVRRAAPTRICIPRQASSGQLGDVLINYLRDYPEIRHETIGFLANFAFLRAFPCF